MHDGADCIVVTTDDSDYCTLAHVQHCRPSTYCIISCLLPHTPSVHSVIELNYRIQPLLEAAAPQRTSTVSASALRASQNIPRATSDVVRVSIYCTGLTPPLCV